MTKQQEIATLKSGAIVYRDEYKNGSQYSYSPYYKGENTVNPADSPLTAFEQTELTQIQQQRIAANARKHTSRR